MQIESGGVNSVLDPEHPAGFAIQLSMMLHQSSFIVLQRK